MRVCLLGPERLRPTLAEAARALGVEADGPIATITAGWQEREAEDRELDEHLGGRTVNLALWARAEAVFARDAELARALGERLRTLREFQALYRVRLAHAMAACLELLRLPGDDTLLADERAAAIAAVRELDQRHLARVAEVHGSFEARWRPLERELVAGERERIATLLRGTVAVAIAGGQVAVLLNRMRLFDVPGLLDGAPVLAWSAGAMAIADHVVLFHDAPPHGPGRAEVFGAGCGLAPEVLPFPHARRRLRLDDSARVQLSARRFAPAACVPLDDGEHVDRLDAGWRFAQGTRRMGIAGTLDVWAE